MAVGIRYTTGRAANLRAIVWTADRESIRNVAADATLTAVGSVAAATFARGRITPVEQSLLGGTSPTGCYTVTLPALAAGYYVIDYYDVATPADNSPAYTDVPVASDLIYWNGTVATPGAYATGMTPATLNTAYAASDLETDIAAINATNIGSGADECTLTITDGSDPIADASVWISTDPGGDTIVAGTLVTDVDGEALFMLDAGSTYYLWVQKAGINSVTGESFVAVADV